MLIIMDTLEIQKDIHEAKLVIPKSPDPLDLASIIYTSGTSGASKGVMLSHKNLVAASVMNQELFPVNSEDIFLSILPLSHAYECSLGMILPFTQGSSVVYLDGAPTPSLLLPALKEVRPTIILSVPLIVEKIYKNKVRPIFTKNLFMQILYTLPHVRRIFHKMAGKKLVQMFGGRLRFFGIGGSKLDGVVERFLADSGFPYAIGYGLTETSPLLAGAVPGGVKWQSTGPKLKRVEMKILNPNNKNIGEIVVKGDNVMMGYYKDLDTTATCFTNDGWFRTKDLGMIDKVGNLFIKGRLDNMIVGPNGENIYPEEIEAIINEHDLVLESLVAQIKGKLIAKVHFNYEQIEALHQLYENAEESLTEKVEKVKKELKDYVNDRVNKASKIIEIIEQQVPFEKTATQKIKRYLYN
ncbi:2-succinylbenzoate--CoA ligase [bioreactor metagenome]|uniref:2-succinylbenzoate--CoA ligase n=1 Tax=bioreactor metagenome TaxID=1076179 RepID=A0A644XRB0_9ZZZZ